MWIECTSVNEKLIAYLLNLVTTRHVYIARTRWVSFSAGPSIVIQPHVLNQLDQLTFLKKIQFNMAICSLGSLFSHSLSLSRVFVCFEIRVSMHEANLWNWIYCKRQEFKHQTRFVKSIPCMNERHRINIRWKSFMHRQKRQKYRRQSGFIQFDQHQPPTRCDKITNRNIK